MDCNVTRLAYPDTGYFSKIIVDYVNQEPALKDFYTHAVNVEGMAAAINARAQFDTDRKTLVEALNIQYATTPHHPMVKANIHSLSDTNTFTICTAHQPVIFTGTLYFIYKILHAVRLARHCESQFPGKKFVPVYYMGSEDADLEELGKIYMGTEKLVWDTKQKGAVGRMNTKGLEKIIARIEGETLVHPFGAELISLFKEIYLNSPDIQTATFRLLNHLFGEFGLVILIPDTGILKSKMINVFRDDLFLQKPSEIVGQTTARLSKYYKVQANPREINLFYLKDDIRELISFNGTGYEVRNTEIQFSPEDIEAELNSHPERFSPNVILRGLFQETILPNVAFIGGGGETAYWLELQDLFRYYSTPFPMLVLRNSFQLIPAKWTGKMEKLSISPAAVFGSADDLVTARVRQLSERKLNLDEEIERIRDEYDHLKMIASEIDPSLLQHVDSLRTRAIKAVETLQKKMLRAEKRKFADEKNQIDQLKANLFPLNGLQERIDNFIIWFAKYGPAFFQLIYDNSPALEQEFTVLTEKHNRKN